MLRLAQEGKRILRDLIDEKMRAMPDWADFIEEAGMSTHILDEYLQCGRDAMSEEHLTGLACALGMGPVELYGELRWEAPKDEESDGEAAAWESALLLEKGKELERCCNELLAQEDKKGFTGPYNELWSLFKASEHDDVRRELVTHVANLAYALGKRAYDHFDFFGLCSAYNDTYSITKTMPESPEAALICVKLAVGVFELKLSLREFENTESYVDELLPLAARFPDDEEFTEQSAVCLCNLLQLCPYDRGVFTSRMFEIVNCIEALADRFLQNAELQLCYLRSLVFLLCFGKPRLPDELYGQYYEQIKVAFAERREGITEHDLNEMLFVLAKSDIYL